MTKHTMRAGARPARTHMLSVLARVKLDTATVDHVALDTSFPAAAGGYQGPEWAAPASARPSRDIQF